MRIHTFTLLFALLGVTVFTGGCQTSKHDAEPYPKAASKIEFAPMVPDVAIQAGEGRYPDLYTGASHATWDRGRVAVAPMAETAGPVANGEEKDMAAPDITRMVAASNPQRRGLKIECFLESEFADRSIAYDAVGLRGVSIYLQLPDGQEIPPSQKILDSDLKESPVGALRRYGRNLTLYFPDQRFLVENPAVNPSARGVRLVLEGQETAFYFEWRAMPNFVAKSEARLDYQVRETVGRGYRATAETAKGIFHNFD